MKTTLKILAIVLGTSFLCLSTMAPVRAQQDVPVISPTIKPPIGVNVDTFAPIELKAPWPDPTVAEIVDVLADYRLIYDPSPSFCEQFYGKTSPMERTIRICGELSLPFRRATVIHELLHAISWQRSFADVDQLSEAEVQSASARLYVAMFGPKP